MISPNDDDLLSALKILYSEQPNLGAEKIQVHLKKRYTDWTVSLKRIKRLRYEHDMVPGQPEKKERSNDTIPKLPLENVRLHDKPGGAPSEAYRAHQSLLRTHFSKGHKEEECWYPILPEDVDTYDYDKVIWIRASVPKKFGELSWFLLEDYKNGALIGNMAAICMLFRRLKKTLDSTGVHVSDKRLARQLEAEYGIRSMDILDDVRGLMETLRAGGVENEENLMLEVVFAMENGALGPPRAHWQNSSSKQARI